jgi:hypothetical protein
MVAAGRPKKCFLLLAVVVASCEPRLSSDDGLVTSPRVIAVRGEPPETKPGASATFTAFIADPDAATPTDDAGYDGRDVPAWSFCTAPKPPAENTVVSSACLESAALVRVGTGDTPTLTLPADGCARFGPIAAPGGFRPRDPDLTGGYYQPLRVDLEKAAPVFHLARISCGVANATNDVATRFAATYEPNRNPHITSLGASIDGRPASLDAIPRGARVELVVGWDASDAERYVYFDPGTLTLGSAREAMQIAWYVGAGALRTESTGLGADDERLRSENDWTAPFSTGSSRLWIVLRDSRGGVDVLTRTLDVVP